MDFTLPSWPAETLCFTASATARATISRNPRIRLPRQRLPHPPRHRVRTPTRSTFGPRVPNAKAFETVGTAQRSGSFPATRSTRRRPRGGSARCEQISTRCTGLARTASRRRPSRASARRRRPCGTAPASSQKTLLHAAPRHKQSTGPSRRPNAAATMLFTMAATSTMCSATRASPASATLRFKHLETGCCTRRCIGTRRVQTH